MKKLIILGALVFVVASVWSVSGALSSDALSMGVGVLLGALMGLPFVLMVLVSGQRGFTDDDIQCELQMLRRENIRLQTALDTRQLRSETTHSLRSETTHSLRVVGEWEE